MSKKSFKGGLDSLLGGSPEEQEIKKRFDKVKPTAGRPKTKKTITKESQRGTKEGEIRATFILKESLVEKIKDMAYWERVQIKDFIGSLIEEAISRYEKKNGPTKPRGKK